MKITMKYAQYEQRNQIKSLDEAMPLMKSFAAKHGLTEECWPEFKIEGEFNVHPEVGFDQPLSALFG